ncbi:MAG: hypothetical protein R3E02_09880 [Blastomonas sp.]
MPADFERFAPKTALDMVRQIPGFSIDEVEERRGLGQGGSNVLVNGQRFAGKSNDIVAELSRISATRVVRIELVDGATLNIPGLSGQVVNIIAEIGGVSGQFSWNPRIRFKRTPPQLLDAEVSITGKTGKLGYTFSLSNVSRRDGNAGLERVLDASGTLTEQRYEDYTVNRDRPRIAASLKYDADNGATGNLNLSYERYWGRANEDSDGQLIRDRDFYETEKEYNYELGGDYEFPLGGGRLKLIGLRRFEHSPFFTRALLFYEDGRPDEGTRQRRRADETETILRSEYGWHGGGADWQISLEGALNKLDNEVRLESLNANGVFDPVPLPGANSEVREKRAESAISYGRPLTPTLTLQASLGGEYSQITQSGPNGLTRSFIRPKGYVSLAWKANPRLDISARIEREVGQLDFFDFVASTDISAGNQNAANPNLVPQQSWNLSLEATQDLAAWGSLNIRGFINFVSDIVDQIPIGATGEAPGNLDSARVWGVALDSTLKLDPLGWSGAKLDAKVSLQKSSVADPLTGDKRRISEDFVREIDIALRHDIPRSNWAYGASYFEFREAREVRLGEIQRPLAKPGDLGIFVENKDVLGMTARLGLYNLLGTDESLERTVYVNRRTGPVRFVEDRHRDFGPILAIDLSGSF